MSIRSIVTETDKTLDIFARNITGELLTVDGLAINGDITAVNGTFTGSVSVTNSISATGGTFTGNISAEDGIFNGAVSADSYTQVGDSVTNVNVRIRDSLGGILVSGVNMQVTKRGDEIRITLDQNQVNFTITNLATYLVIEANDGSELNTAFVPLPGSASPYHQNLTGQVNGSRVGFLSSYPADLGGEGSRIQMIRDGAQNLASTLNGGVFNFIFRYFI